MDEIEQTNKVKILEELQKNARASTSEIAEKTGLSRQTVAKTINDMKKNKEIWGYTTIFDPKLIGRKQFIILARADLSINPEDLFKKSTNTKAIDEVAEKYGFKTALLLNGSSDFMIKFWAKDIIDAKKLMNSIKKTYGTNIKEIEILDVMATFRCNGISNPNMVDEWKNLLF
jgi:DNA-binding Lrp family transcriptional regulator